MLALMNEARTDEETKQHRHQLISIMLDSAKGHELHVEPAIETIAVRKTNQWHHSPFLWGLYAWSLRC